MKLKHYFIFFLFLFPTGLYCQDHYTLSGTVTDSITGKTLDGIDIYVKDRCTGTISNWKGTYLLYLKKGMYEIVYSAKGYNTAHLKVNLNANQVQVVEMMPKSDLLHTDKELTRKRLLNKQKDTEIFSDNASSGSNSGIKH